MVIGGAHPRSRGENIYSVTMSVWNAGSSPLTRGKQQIGHTHEALDRLIPAHAGKTRWSRASVATRAAHPRSRGENFGLEEDSGLVDGSSPLTRGKRKEESRER